MQIRETKGGPIEVVVDGIEDWVIGKALNTPFLADAVMSLPPVREAIARHVNEHLQEYIRETFAEIQNP